MVWTQATLDALDLAYASGAETVRFADGRQVGYRSVDEYLALRRLMLTDIAEAAGQTVVKLVRVGFTSGVGP